MRIKKFAPFQMRLQCNRSKHKSKKARKVFFNFTGHWIVWGRKEQDRVKERIRAPKGEKCERVIETETERQSVRER